MTCHSSWSVTFTDITLYTLSFHHVWSTRAPREACREPCMQEMQGGNDVNGDQEERNDAVGMEGGRVRREMYFQGAEETTESRQG